jgi:hypothetical protein
MLSDRLLFRGARTTTKKKSTATRAAGAVKLGTGATRKRDLFPSLRDQQTGKPFRKRTRSIGGKLSEGERGDQRIHPPVRLLFRCARTATATQSGHEVALHRHQGAWPPSEEAQRAAGGEQRAAVGDGNHKQQMEAPGRGAAAGLGDNFRIMTSRVHNGERIVSITRSDPNPRPFFQVEDAVLRDFQILKQHESDVRRSDNRRRKPIDRKLICWYGIGKT